MQLLWTLTRISKVLPYLALPLTPIKSNVTHFPHLKSPMTSIEYRVKSVKFLISFKMLLNN